MLQIFNFLNEIISKIKRTQFFELPKSANGCQTAISEFYFVDSAWLFFSSSLKNISFVHFENIITKSLIFFVGLLVTIEWDVIDRNINFKNILIQKI